LIGGAVRIPLATTILLLTLSPAAPAARTGETPFDLLQDGSIVVPVTIGGMGTYRFVIDTGSSRTVISTRLWQALRLPVVAKTLMVTPGGRNDAYVVRLDRLAVGGRPEVSVTAAVMPAERYAAGQQVDGLIGQDVLSSAIYTIDYGDSAIVWHSPADVLRGVRLPLNVRNHRVLVNLPQYQGDPRPLSMIPDTGSDALVLFAHARDKVRFTSLDFGVLSSVSGTKLARRIQLDGLVVGQARLQNPFAVVVETEESSDLMGDGLLPLHVFSRVTFDVTGGFLIVQ
jgi:predicted aspartyl protease